MSESQTPEPSQPADGKYLMVVGGLLLLIIASLAALWLTERHRRSQAESALNQMTDRYKKLESVLTKELFGAGSQQQGELRPADVISRKPGQAKGTYDWRISAEGGKRMGFSPGDTVTVASQEASPASEPAGE